MNTFKLTKFAKLILFILLLGILSIIGYFLSCTYYVTNTTKLIDNNQLILNNGFYFSTNKPIYKILDFPSTYDPIALPDEFLQASNIFVTKDIPLELQLNDGSIYTCKFFITSTFDLKWVLQYKRSPVINIPEYTLNSYILDHVGHFSKQDLFKAETKNKLENIIKDWLIQNTKGHGIIIKTVKINTVFMPLTFKN